MKKTTLILLSSVGMLFAVSGPAFSHQSGAKVFTGGTGATTKSVNIFQPTRNQPPIDSAGQDQSIVLNKTFITYNVRQPEHESRAERRKRAIGHRYLGFIKQYRGYKYPF